MTCVKCKCIYAFLCTFQVKAAVTRAYNKEGHLLPYSTGGEVSKKRVAREEEQEGQGSGEESADEDDAGAELFRVSGRFFHTGCGSVVCLKLNHYISARSDPI